MNRFNILLIIMLGHFTAYFVTHVFVVKTVLDELIIYLLREYVTFYVDR